MGGALRLGGLGAALTLVAAALDAEPLFVPGVALLLIAAGACGWVWAAAHGLSVTRAVGSTTVVEGAPITVRTEVRSPWLLTPTGTLDDGLLGEPVALEGGRDRGVRVLHATPRFPRRGRIALPPPEVTVRDPFGLAVRTVAGHPHELLVLPAIHPVLRTDGGGDGDAIGRRQARSRVTAEVELDGLRPLRSGTSAARISWAVWARTGEMYERHLRPDGDDRPIVVLDTRTASPGAGPGETTIDADEQLDAAVRATASLCVFLAGRGGCSLLLPGDRQPVALQPGLGGWPRQHIRLALVRGGGTPAAGALTGRIGVIFYVSAQPLTGTPRVLAHAAGNGRVLVVPAGMPGRTPTFEVAGCSGYDLAPRGAVHGTAA
ncbi:hypothetical protein DSM112329_02626 [Paraconexibacter sp. AEG42_29]|uniref:DUF58 domain-containing protein n=1 Tax=Paraconexibacter sp. AEG42_29 TaxID=2997339 RepID=A0AAU7AVU8_9ACTN